MNRRKFFGTGIPGAIVGGITGMTLGIMSSANRTPEKAFTHEAMMRHDHTPLINAFNVCLLNDAKSCGLPVVDDYNLRCDPCTQHLGRVTTPALSFDIDLLLVDKQRRRILERIVAKMDLLLKEALHYKATFMGKPETWFERSAFTGTFLAYASYARDY